MNQMRWVALMCLALAATACSSKGKGGSTSGGTSTNPADIKSFEESFNQAICAYGQRCNIIDGSVSCAAWKDDLFAAVGGTTQGLALDSAQAKACLAELQSTSCTDGIDLSSTDDPCSLALTGTVALGGSCQTSNSCRGVPDGGYVICHAPIGSCGGTCTVGANLGESCADINCAQGYCDYEGSNLCVAYASLGDTCESSYPDGGLLLKQCDPATSDCNYDQTSGTEKCVALAAQGEACQFNGCQPGLYCASGSGSTETCQPQVAQGQPCTDPEGCISGLICANGTCVNATAKLGEPCSPGVTCTTGTCDPTSSKCVAYLAQGATCTSGGLECADGLQCTSGQCTALSSEGGSCTSGEDCRIGLICQSGSCVTGGLPGEACNGPDSCFSPGTFCGQGNMCTSFAAAGTACDPTQPGCGEYDCNPAPDGGMACVDYGCQKSASGAYVCSGYCP